MKIKYTCNVVKWFDKINGNTYHSVRIVRHEDGEIIVGQFQYGYGESYKDTALSEMLKAGWLPPQYAKENLYLFERENNYPVFWVISEGLKRECITNGVVK